jgi:hypothetical protein
MRKYIIFKADGEMPGWEERKLQHTQLLTRLLTEYYDSSNEPIPEPGYRPIQLVRVEAEHDSSFHGYNTHYKTGDWEVTRVETYTPDLPHSEFDIVVICYCQYSPIDAPLNPMPERQVSIDSFGGDKEAYKRWLDSQPDKQAAEV